MKKELKICEDFYIFNCPNCSEEIIVKISELNCRIFRHAVYKNNYEQVNPHLSQIDCERHVREKLVYGCCKPFEIITENFKNYAQICGYK